MAGGKEIVPRGDNGEPDDNGSVVNNETRGQRILRGLRLITGRPEYRSTTAAGTSTSTELTVGNPDSTTTAAGETTRRSEIPDNEVRVLSREYTIAQTVEALTTTAAELLLQETDWPHSDNHHHDNAILKKNFYTLADTVKMQVGVGNKPTNESLTALILHKQRTRGSGTDEDLVMQTQFEIAATLADAGMTDLAEDYIQSLIGKFGGSIFTQVMAVPPQPHRIEKWNKQIAPAREAIARGIARTQGTDAAIDYVDGDREDRFTNGIYVPGTNLLIENSQPKFFWNRPKMLFELARLQEGEDANETIDLAILRANELMALDQEQANALLVPNLREAQIDLALDCLTNIDLIKNKQPAKDSVGQPGTALEIADSSPEKLFEYIKQLNGEIGSEYAKADASKKIVEVAYAIDRPDLITGYVEDQIEHVFGSDNPNWAYKGEVIDKLATILTSHNIRPDYVEEVYTRLAASDIKSAAKDIGEILADKGKYELAYRFVGRQIDPIDRGELLAKIIGGLAEAGRVDDANSIYAEHQSFFEGGSEYDEEEFQRFKATRTGHTYKTDAREWYDNSWDYWTRIGKDAFTAKINLAYIRHHAKEGNFGKARELAGSKVFDVKLDDAAEAQITIVAAEQTGNINAQTDNGLIAEQALEDVKDTVLSTPDLSFNMPVRYDTYPRVSERVSIDFKSARAETLRRIAEKITQPQDETQTAIAQSGSVIEFDQLTS